MPSGSSEVRVVGTPVGEARVHVSRSPGTVRGTLVLGHGAGGGVGVADLEALARGLPQRGVTVVRVEQPWRVAGKRVASPPATLDRAWTAVLRELGPQAPFVLGGRSAGARVACRTAVELGADGVVALAFPLHPPGRPEKTRLGELDLPTEAGLPVLVLQGTRDTFGGPADVPAAPGRTVRAVEGADHSFRVLKGGDQRAMLTALVDAVAEWLLARWGESSPSGRG